MYSFNSRMMHFIHLRWMDQINSANIFWPLPNNLFNLYTMHIFWMVFKLDEREEQFDKLSLSIFFPQIFNTWWIESHNSKSKPNFRAEFFARSLFQFYLLIISATSYCHLLMYSSYKNYTGDILYLPFWPFIFYEVHYKKKYKHTI